MRLQDDVSFVCMYITGLWIADLGVNQVLQAVESDIRGSISAVQSSMNMIFDGGKFLLVIALPRPSTFGFLILMSFVAVLIG